jgi:hypothetical protein
VVSVTGIISNVPSVFQSSLYKRIPLELIDLTFVQGLGDTPAGSMSPVKGESLLFIFSLICIGLTHTLQEISLLGKASLHLLLDPACPLQA